MYLSLIDCSLNSKDCEIIATSEVFKLLRNLDLSCNHIGLEGLIILSDSNMSLIDSVEELILFNCGIDLPEDHSGGQLSLGFFSDLWELNLSHNSLKLWPLLPPSIEHLSL